jgi:diketogulonate reductase-like aldo/keto reductase
MLGFKVSSCVQLYLTLVPQVEMHPGWQQQTLRAFCKPRGILVSAFSSLGAPGTFYGRNDILSLPVVLELASKYKKSPAQVLSPMHYVLMKIIR